ncbi:MAG: hypothetical protein IPK80_30785 [Nannocystis sp.]|nr:hypothetical protein [Nannocystis sp.]
MVARFDTSTADWLDAINSSIHITAECKVPGSDWIEVLAKHVGLAYEHFEQVAGTGVGFKLSRIEQVGPRSGRLKLKLKAKVAGDKKTLKEERFTFNF